MVEILNPVSSVSNSYAWNEIYFSNQLGSPFSFQNAIAPADGRLNEYSKMEHSAPGLYCGLHVRLKKKDLFFFPEAPHV